MLLFCRKHLVSPVSLPLHEVIYYNDVGVVRCHINGSPRSTIQSALNKPDTYIPVSRVLISINNQEYMAHLEIFSYVSFNFMYVSPTSLTQWSTLLFLLIFIICKSITLLLLSYNFFGDIYFYHHTHGLLFNFILLFYLLLGALNI